MSCHTEDSPDHLTPESEYGVILMGLLFFKQMFSSCPWGEFANVDSLSHIVTNKIGIAVQMNGKRWELPLDCGLVGSKQRRGGGHAAEGWIVEKSHALVRSCGMCAGNRAEEVGVRGCGSLPQHPPVPAMRPSVLPGTSFWEYSWPCKSVIKGKEVQAIPEPLLEIVVGKVHRGLLTLHFFDKSALFQQIKTKCWYNNPDLNWQVKPCSKARVAVWEIAQYGHAVRSFEICPGAGDTAAIWTEPTTSVSISVQRKPTVWTAGGGLFPEEDVCCSSDAFGKLWKEAKAYFYSFGFECVTSFHVS